MNITLSPELKRFVEAKIGNGRYAAAGDVVREAVRLMEARDRLASGLQVGAIEPELLANLGQQGGDIELLIALINSSGRIIFGQEWMPRLRALAAAIISTFPPSDRIGTGSIALHVTLVPQLATAICRRCFLRV